ncbi:MAG: hypothetical protein ACREFE_13035 [Limisphaerales bacterium]
MISVIAKEKEHPIVNEFFELFKTPWEFHHNGRQSDVMICSNIDVPKTDAKLVLIYGGEPNAFDRVNGIQIRSQCSKSMLLYNGARIPIYGNNLAFGNSTRRSLIDKNSHEPAMLEITKNGQTIIRIGYDLFHEIGQLLTVGQPAAFAELPALELHIALLRDLIVEFSIPLLEIPPIPEGYNFIACLTHDVDHPGIRNHKFDHTMFGFLYRATIESFMDFCKGKKSFRQLTTNWVAALSLPLVHLGIVEDFWHKFDQYVEIENKSSSTFFVIPQKGNPGRDVIGDCPPKRAASYDADKMAEQLKKLQSTGHEIGVHGIDAWRDCAAGHNEFRRISQLTGSSELGVRMHWLFFDGQSPVTLEDAGFSYDSSIGYNETIGYRAGTTQAFKPLQTVRMLELPMHVMDTALFYPSYMNFTFRQAESAVSPLIHNVVHFGGALTVNWHDRSIAPERLWGDFYIRLLEKLETNGAWFADAAQTVSWFRKRRSVTFERVISENGSIKLKTNYNSNDGLPGLRIRTFKMDEMNFTTGFADRPLQCCNEKSLAI